VPSDALAAIFVFASLSCAIVGVAHYWAKARIAKLTHSVDVEKRLARLEVAIDDLTAELSRVTEGQQLVSRLLTDRSPEASHVPR
jgi:CHASE3 domain sensor protein